MSRPARASCSAARLRAGRAGHASARWRWRMGARSRQISSSSASACCQRRSGEGGGLEGRERDRRRRDAGDRGSAISAIGDCASFPSVHADGARVGSNRFRTPSTGARCVATRLTGRPAAFRRCRGSGATGAAQAADRRPVPAARPRRAPGRPRTRGRLGVCTGAGASPGSNRSPSGRSHDRPPPAPGGTEPMPDQAADPGFDIKALALS